MHCGVCGEGRVVMAYGPGRVVAYKDRGGYEIPTLLAVPTCDRCGEMFIDEAVTKALDAAFEPLHAAREGADGLEEGR